MIRVAIADDHPELRLALQLLLRTFEGIELICKARDGREAIECVRRYQPDVLVMDIRMPELDGLAALKEIRGLAAPTRVILISTLTDSSIAMRAKAAGAHGFLPKDRLVASLRPAIEAVYRGERFFPDL